MTNINLREDSPIDQLVAATHHLIEESIGIFTGLSLPDLTPSELNKLGTNLLKSIDRTSTIVDRLDGIPNPDLIKLRITLQQGIDQLYTTLINVKTDWANRVVALELNGSQTIDYGAFCYSLALKLTERVSQAVIENNHLPEEEIIDEEIEKWL